MSGDGGDSWILRTVSFYLPLSHPARRLVLSIKPLCCRVEEDGRKCGKTVRTENVLQSQCSEQVELWRAGRQGMVPESGLLPGRPASLRTRQQSACGLGGAARGRGLRRPRVSCLWVRRIER